MSSSAPDHRSHGGRTRELASAVGLPEDELLDFSASINPAGPPPWLPAAVEEGAGRIGRYPDPDSELLRAAAARRFGVGEERFVFADGADSLLLALPRALGAASLIAASPSYSGYRRSARRAGARLVSVRLDASESFSLAAPDFALRLRAALAAAPSPALVLLGAPNNPAGGFFPDATLRALTDEFPAAFFAVDESFSELAGKQDGLVRGAGGRLLVLRSMTKTWAVPGARLGYLAGDPQLVAALRAELPSWPVSSFAEAIALRAFADRDWPVSSAALVAEEEARLVAALGALRGSDGASPRGGLRIHRSGANFILLELPSSEDGARLADFLLGRGIALRRFSAEEGLDGRYLRAAVRPRSENERFTAAVADFLALPEASA